MSGGIFSKLKNLDEFEPKPEIYEIDVLVMRHEEQDSNPFIDIVEGIIESGSETKQAEECFKQNMRWITADRYTVCRSRWVSEEPCDLLISWSEQCPKLCFAVIMREIQHRSAFAELFCHGDPIQMICLDGSHKDFWKYAKDLRDQLIDNWYADST